MNKIYFLTLITVCTVYAQEQIGSTIYPQNPIDEEAFGSSISMSNDGNTLVAGSVQWTDPTLGQNTGRTTVFTFDGSAWNQKGSFIASDRALAGFGANVDISSDGNTYCVGAPFYSNNTVTPRQGRVTVYIYDSSIMDWNQKGQQILGDNAGDRLGGGLAMSADGNRIALGAVQYDTETLSNCGLIRCYQYNPTNNMWEQMGTDITGVDGERLGLTLGMTNDGNRIAVSAQNGTDGTNANCGKITIYDWDGTTWNQSGAPIYGDNANEEFGFDLDFSSDGSKLAISSYKSNSNAGKVKTYNFDGTNWVQMANTLDGTNGEAFGKSIDLSEDGTVLVVGAPFNVDNGGSQQGKVEFYKLENNVWTESDTSIAYPVTANNLQAGTSVALSADNQKVAVGTFYDYLNNINPGSVKVYSLGSVLKIEDIKQNAQEVSVYPTITSSLLNIKVKNDLDVKSISIYSAEGRLINQLEFKNQIDVSNLKAGVYYLVLHSANSSNLKEKFIKK